MANKECIACAESINENAKLCRFCNTEQLDERFISGKAALQKANAKATKTNSCPVCQQSDSVQRVATIQSSGTTNSISMTSITQAGSVLPSAYGLTGGVSASQLVSRLNYGYPSPPIIGPLLLGLGGIFLGIPMTYFGVVLPAAGKDEMGAWNPIDLTPITLMFFISIIAPFFLFAFLRNGQKQNIDAISKASAYLSDCFYCFRDDVLFDDGNRSSPEYLKRYLNGDTHSRPEDFKRYLLASFLVEPEAEHESNVGN